REKTNPIRLLEDIRRRYALILRKQNKLAKREAQGMTTPGSAPFTPLTSPSSLDPLGVQYLTDRHRLKKTYGVFSI
ncbi:MAG: hypothetical protein PHG74_10250, partial [Kiritimatiellae bacterium]|nr:hypothetical protein [Kiritimatiellia bacterium]HHU13854.1 hypothetical protein [Lentisphaerota bacterium]